MSQALQPKDRWRLASNDRTNKWLDWCAEPANHQVLETALAQMTMELDAGSPQDATTAFYQLTGAKRLIKILLNLAEEARPQVVPTSPMLKPT